MSTKRKTRSINRVPPPYRKNNKDTRQPTDVPQPLDAGLNLRPPSPTTSTISIPLQLMTF